MAEKKRGILLMNLGSPDSTDPKDVKRYLDDFLMDG
jgi:ferrochelatase